jgi:hypothetical protein
MKKITYLLLALALPIMAMKCDKDEPVEEKCNGDIACELAKLPPLTTEGKGTFGCLVNGKAWLPKGLNGWGGANIPEFYSSYNKSLGYYYLSANFLEEKIDEFISFHINSPIQLSQKKYVLNKTYPEFSSSRLVKCNGGDDCISVAYETDSSYSGNFEFIFIDTTRQIVSGVFDFKAQATNGDTIEVIEGRFDIQYEHYQ